MPSLLAHTQHSYVETLVSLLGKGRQHAARLYSHWFRKGNLAEISHWAEPQALSLLNQMMALSDFSLPLLSRVQEDGDVLKFLLKFADGLESESVLIPMESGTTICISSQVGCKMGCAFCETGKMGLIRHLTAEEIVAQVFLARFHFQRKIRNIVFMGMGEPFDNYEAVMQAVSVLTDPAGLGFGKRRITLSTSGRVDGILRMAKEADPALNLAVSVNAPTDEIRRKIMPVNKEWNLAALKEAMHIYCSTTHQEILIEYVLLKGVNDSVACAESLADYLSGLQVKVNLIPYNAQTRDRFSPPDSEQKEAFLQAMRARGYQTLLRGTKGDQIQAACGQLGNVAVRRQHSLRT